MIHIDDKKKCCGCTACISSCPVSCIKMCEDEEGFLYPSVNEQSCIDCKLCEHVCPILNPLADDRPVSGSLAMNLDTDIRSKSSSGGIFSALAEYILRSGGIVYGAAYDDDFLVHHIGAKNSEELAKLRGSKYVQSRMEAVYPELREQLNTGRIVLFSGTGCQVAGLKQFLAKDYDNLYTVDVLCHGVPSTKVYMRYLQEKERKYGSKISNICFRYKETGWKTYSVHIDFENGQSYEERFRHDDYMKVFLSDVCLRPSCHDCHYKDLNRPSDLTIGDAWGVDSYNPEMDDNKGTSLILSRGEKGNQLLDAIRDQLRLVPENPDKILPAWNNARHSVAPHKKRAKFFAKFQKGKSVSGLTKMVQDSIWKRGYYKIRNILKK